jgi:predicted outer membrane protein
MAIRNLAILSIAVALFSASACSGDDDSAGTAGTGGAAAGQAGKSGGGGTAGKGTSGAAGKGGRGGSSAGGEAGQGQAGTAGEAGHGQAGTAGGGGEGGLGGAGGSVGDLSDGQVLQIAVTMNMGEIDMAALGSSHGTASDVTTFAGGMLAVHNAYDSAAAMLETDENITLEMSAANDAVKAKLDAETAALMAASSDSDFDAVYADSQVTVHENALSVIDHELTPTAENAALKTYLSMIRDGMAMHLSEAKTLANAHPLP